MSVPPSIDLARLAQLARLSLGAEERGALQPELERILRQLAELEALDLGPAPQMIRGGSTDSPLRADEPRAGLARDALLERAPQAEGEFYGVPRTVGGEG